LEEADVQYVVICYGWYSWGAANDVGFQELENWLSFWHFCVRQWGGFMIDAVF